MMETNVSGRYSALELTREDIHRQRRDDRWEYFQNLQAQILYELREFGRCSLLDEALQCRDLYLVDTLALNDAYSILLDKKSPLQYQDGVSLSEGYWRKVNLSWKELNAANTKFRTLYLNVNSETWKRWKRLQEYACRHHARTISVHNGGDSRVPVEELRQLEETNRRLNAELADRDQKLNSLNGELLAKAQTAEELRHQIQTLREQLQNFSDAMLSFLILPAEPS